MVAPMGRFGVFIEAIAAWGIVPSVGFTSSFVREANLPDYEFLKTRTPYKTLQDVVGGGIDAALCHDHRLYLQ